jgi:NAD-dependent dihydropyrimidine dehydrogenase PreA subunit
MAHVVTSKCQGCKFTDCVEVCPVEAIYAEDDVPAEYRQDVEFNAARARAVKEAGQEPLLQTKAPLPTATQKKTALGY